MAYLPSHQTLATHPKTRKAARRLAVSLPTVIGHLHLLWYWALDHAPDGDLSKFDPDDLADAAGWEGDPDDFVKALTDCGPGDSAGFLDPDGSLHDWDDYGGKYGKRVAAARKAAAVRWHSDDDADAMRTHDEGNATASEAHAKGNAEERRGEKRKEPVPRKRATQLPDGWEPTDQHRELARTLGVNADREADQFRDHHAAKGSTFKDWNRAFNTWLRNAQQWSPSREQAAPANGLAL
jgi:hypothetical protein